MLYRLLTLSDEQGVCKIDLEYDPETLSVNKIIYDGHKLTIILRDGIILDSNIFTINGKELIIFPNTFFMIYVDTGFGQSSLEPPASLLYDLLSKMMIIWQ